LLLLLRRNEMAPALEAGRQERIWDLLGMVIRVMELFDVVGLPGAKQKAVHA
jgi:hypothetical protein